MLRKDATLESTIATIREFWFENTRVSPKHGDVLGQCSRTGYAGAQRRLMDLTQTELYLKFCKQNPGLSIGQRMFELYKPIEVRPIRRCDRMTCACIYHVNMSMLLRSWSEYRAQQSSNRVGHQPVQYDTQIPKNSSELVDFCCCDVEHDTEYHSCSCLHGVCGSCGVDRLDGLLHESERNADAPLITARYFKNVDIDIPEDQQVLDKNGNPIKTKKRLAKVAERMSPTAFLDLFKQKAKSFIWHQFEAQWQAAQFKKCVQNIQPGEVVATLDFSENHTFLYSIEPQSLHWTPCQCTLLCFVVYRHAQESLDGVASSPSNPVLVKEHVFFMSDDKEKDTEFVHHCLLQLHREFIVGRGVNMNKLILWSDGCSSQFKCAGVFWDHCLLASKMSQHAGHEVSLEHHYFCSYHGKGEHDSAGAQVKHQASLHQNRSPDADLKNASDLYHFCVQRLKHKKPSSYASRVHDVALAGRFFFLVPADAVDHKNKPAVNTVEGSSKFHSTWFKNVVSMQMLHRNLSCMCGSCRAGDWEHCDNLVRVGLPITHTLQATNNRTLQGASLVANEAHPELPEYVELADLLEAASTASRPSGGDRDMSSNFIVPAPADDSAYEYYIARCVGLPEKLARTETDGYGAVKSRGHWVIRACYFDLKEGSSQAQRVYTYNPTPALIDAHLVSMVDFPMSRQKVDRRKNPIPSHGAQCYYISREDHERAMQAVRVPFPIV